jgi:hypothetical protein
MDHTVPSGDRHRKQRKMLSPMFNINHMRYMSPHFSFGRTTGTFPGFASVGHGPIHARVRRPRYRSRRASSAFIRYNTIQPPLHFAAARRAPRSTCANPCPHVGKRASRPARPSRHPRGRPSKRSRPSPSASQLPSSLSSPVATTRFSSDAVPVLAPPTELRTTQEFEGFPNDLGMHTVGIGRLSSGFPSLGIGGPRNVKRELVTLERGIKMMIELACALHGQPAILLLANYLWKFLPIS